ncbi:Tim44/TimA family putative adaptor protein [Oecophyllibacter saccharovorans]|nr:Tim44/TimA family putative adaptor protein [Oecophyllibacter saccharovorans]
MDGAQAHEELLERMMAHIPWETVTWAVVAVALATALYCVLGRKVGAQGVRQPPRPAAPKAAAALQRAPLQPPPLPGKMENAEKPTQYVVAPEARSLLSQVSAAVPGFTSEGFLHQVNTLFREVLSAYVRGDKNFLAAHLTPAVMASFTQAMDRVAREGLKLHATIRRIERIALNRVTLLPDTEDPAAMMCRLTVAITSWQLSYVTDASGTVVEGTEALTEFHDLWDLTHMPGAEGASVWRLSGTATT